MNWYIDELRSERRCTSTLKGFHVYALWSDEEIIYIGKSTNVMARINTHLRNKVFNGYSFIEFHSEEEMDRIEAWLIYTLQPKLNKTLPTEWFVSLRRIRRAIREISESHKYDTRYYVPNIRKKLHKEGFETYHFRGSEYIEMTDVDRALSVLLGGDNDVGQG